MEHVVFYPGPDGRPAFARFEGMSEAVSFVERLRNVDGVSEASLYVLTPVPMVVRTYYKVEVPPPGEPAYAAPAEMPPVEVAGPVVAPAPVAEVAEPVAAAEPVVPAQPAAEAAPAAEDVPAAENVPAPSEVPVGVGTPDIIAPAANGRRTLGFFSH